MSKEFTREELLEEYIKSSRAIYKAWKVRVHKEVGKDLSPALMGMLHIVSRLQPVPSVDIAKEMHITKGAVAQFVDALYQHNLIKGEVDPNDRRITHISLTKKGEDIIQKLNQVRSKFITQVTHTLSDDELKHTIAISHKILNQLQQK